MVVEISKVRIVSFRTTSMFIEYTTYSYEAILRNLFAQVQNLG